MASLKVKEILCVFYSTLLFISGVILIGFSVYLCCKIVYHFNFIPGSSLGPFILYFLLGFVHLLLTWLGIKGPTHEHDFHLFLFMGITLLLLIGECAVGIWSITLWSDVDVKSIEIMSQSFELLLKSQYIHDKSSWTRLESKMLCCGFNSPNEYDPFNIIPTSCCKPDTHNSTCAKFEIGCKTPLIKYAKGILVDGAIMGFTSGLFQCFGLVAFVFYFRALRQERQKRVQRRVEAQRAVVNGQAPPVPSSAPPPTP